MNSKKNSKRSLCICKYFFLTIATMGLLPGYAAELRAVTTIGSISCEEWQKAMGEKNAVSVFGAPYKGYAAQVYEYWVLGFMSGYNAAYPINKDVLAYTDAKTIVLWMDRYCKMNPKSSTASGSKKLFEELQKITP